MSINKDFTFTKKQENGRLHTPKVCKAAKEYKGACEHCSSDIHKGTFVLTANEVVSVSHGFGVRTVKTHRLCASCTADYIKATSGSAVTTTTPATVERDTVQSDMSRCLEEQKEWVKSRGIEVGSNVYILRSFVTQEGGSNIGWNGTYMAETVGKIGEVIHISNDGAGGILVTVDEYTFWYPHFVLSKVTDYELAQAKWVQENGIKEGMKVRYTRGFREDDSGAVCNAHMNVEGMIGHIEEIKRRCIKVAIDGTPLYFLSPYTALEVIKETIRPFNEDELNDLVGKIVRNKQTRYRKLVTGKPKTSLGVNLEGKYINAKDLLNSFMMDDGKSPCGVKEEV